MERQLIRRAKRGDEDAINEIFIKYKNLIRQTSRKYFTQLEDSDDFASIAKYGIWEAIQKYRLAPVFKVKIRNNKVIKFTIKYDKHDVDFGRFAFMYTRKNTNLAVRKERRRIKHDLVEDAAPIEGVHIGNQDLDKVVLGVKDKLHNEVLEGILKLEILDLTIKQKSDWSIRKMLSLGEDELHSLRSNLVDMTRNQISAFH